MTQINIDFETFSTVDLTRVGLWNYSHHPSTGVHCLSFSFDDGPVQRLMLSPWWTGEYDKQLEAELHKAVAGGAEVVAHNAQFEYAIWNDVLATRFGWPRLKLRQLTCTMAMAYAMSLPGALEDTAPALGVAARKDTVGRSLMLRLCKPTNLNALRDGKADRPDWVLDHDSFTFMGEQITPQQALVRLAEYCDVDVEVQRAIYPRMRRLSKPERQLWQLDQIINRRGARFDMRTVRAGLAMRDRLVALLDEKMAAATDGEVRACTAVQAIKDHLTERYGLEVDSLAKASLDELLADPDLPDGARRILELRKDAGRATSAAKLDAIAEQADPNDQRVRYLAQYHAANTGRWGGRGVQPHNITRDLPKPQVVEQIRQLIREQNVEALDLAFEFPLNVISQILRGLIVPAPGHQLIGGDWSNVEGRGLAWLAGEEWKLDAFRRFDAGKGPDLYLVSYSNVFDVPLDDVTAEQRQIGKVMELSMGYQGGVGAFQSMAVNYGVRVADDVADKAKHAWRQAHPAVVDLWYRTQDAAISAVLHPGKVYSAGAPGRQVKYKKAGSFLWALLPSGRLLCYPYPQIREDDYGPQLTYKRVPTPEDRRRGRIIEDPSNTNRWARIGTYGGMLTENNTQAVCRDILASALVRLEKAGYKPVVHIHDEVVCEVESATEADRQEIERLLQINPPWAKDLPLAAGCWLHHCYMKD